MKTFLTVAAVAMGMTFFAGTAPAQAGSECQGTSRPCLTATRHDLKEATQAHTYWSYDYTKSVSHFRLHVSKKPSFKKKARIHTGTYTSSSALLTKNEGLRGLERYFIRVRTFYNNGTRSQWSKPRIIRTGVPTLSGIKVVDRTKSSVTVDWKRRDKVEEADLLYDVRVKRPGKNGAVITTRTVLGTSAVTVRGLKPSKKYVVQVRGKDEAVYGTGQWSSGKKFSTKARKKA